MYKLSATIKIFDKGGNAYEYIYKIRKSASQTEKTPWADD